MCVPRWPITSGRTTASAAAMPSAHHRRRQTSSAVVVTSRRREQDRLDHLAGQRGPLGAVDLGERERLIRRSNGNRPWRQRAISWGMNTCGTASPSRIPMTFAAGGEEVRLDHQRRGLHARRGRTRRSGAAHRWP